MVNGLWTGIFTTESDVQLEIEAKLIPKRGKNHAFVIDGVALAEFILKVRNQSNNCDLWSGGNYDLYALEIIRFFKVLKSINAKAEIVLPLSRLMGNINQFENDASTQAQRYSSKNIFKINADDAKNNDIRGIYPHFIFQVIKETANKLRIPLVYTKFDLKRYIAKIISIGDADACIISDSEYLIFPQIKAIPIDSFYHTESGVLICSYFTDDMVARHVGLVNRQKLVELSIIMGNHFTSPLWNDRYNIYTLLHTQPDPIYPSILMVASVEKINQDYHFFIEELSPFTEIINVDPDLRTAIDKSRAYFDISDDLPSEGDSFCRHESEKGHLPPWAAIVDEGNDLWIDPCYDDYNHDVNALKITIPFREAFCSILSRESVIEHFVYGDGPNTRSVKLDQNIPSLIKVKSLDEQQRYELLYQVIHKNFPTLPLLFDDPINQIEEPMRTSALAIRFLLSTCFTDHQTQYTKITDEQMDLQKKYNIQGAPCLDFFEFKSLVAMSICCVFLDLSNVEIPNMKTSLRKSHVSALYQTTVQHVIWLQQFFDLRRSMIEPERFWNGRLFSLIYESNGKILNKIFGSLFDNKLLKTLDATRIQPLIKIIMYPFPGELFEAFSGCPRCLPISSFQFSNKKKEVNWKTGEFTEVEVEDTNKRRHIQMAPLPPPVSRKESPKKRQEIDEDEEIAFLQEMAKKNKGGPKIVEAKKTNTNKTKENSFRKKLTQTSQLELIKMMNEYMEKKKLPPGVL
ncbi:hypothetical protein TVAG_353440 [Trichomonas vaginalis G3]|uniref:XPG N-terminal domain-containing protein n=1 Tax=Trichomonas vaginalis (strain ATCC PRA-98 / G3) TaxID=412133 RepID=A2EN66_TRIV3|nr:asteroid protein family [Trichomonas vaginalis G3]EAY05903.1 hypothetical protein TVAG_353440 [Trichomonas vaginalis G3]KAI5520213.1 asteroid protein family [Trichomonas vaginalis G3]|eukprot:XP_001318126.1 hypothetical protein [Trichomonas vaginalis G3]